jgi:hypothetical protein
MTVGHAAMRPSARGPVEVVEKRQSCSTPHNRPFVRHLHRGHDTPTEHAAELVSGNPWCSRTRPGGFRCRQHMAHTGVGDVLRVDLDEVGDADAPSTASNPASLGITTTSAAAMAICTRRPRSGRLSMRTSGSRRAAPVRAQRDGTCRRPARFTDWGPAPGRRGRTAPSGRPSDLPCPRRRGPAVVP